MRPYYILVEGVNIGANVFDTNQLSVIRGGSFLLKDAIERIGDQFYLELNPISTGASSGLFQVRDSVAAPDDLQRRIIDQLRDHTYFRLLTFIVEICKAGSLFEAKEKLLAQLRFQQLRSINIAPDRSSENSSSPSDWSGIRPIGPDPDSKKKRAKVTYYGSTPPEEVLLSTSEKRRWNYGRDKKQNYYMEEVEKLDMETEESESYQELRTELEEYGFTRDLGEIADNDAYPKLKGKIAVFYADGNDFGKTQRDAIKRASKDQQIQTQQRFDRTIRTQRARLLATVLKEMLNKESHLFLDMETRSIDNAGDPQKALRFETLLWGGDELLFVMPAWIGFEFVQLFFRETAKWNGIDDKPLTHSAGLVFCSAKTPIRITRDLARTIADHLKKETKKTPAGKTDAWDYMVLESIDYPADGDYALFLRERYRSIADKQYRPLFIPPWGSWADERAALIELIRERLPARQLYQLGQLLTRTSPQACFAGGTDKKETWPPPEGEHASALEEKERRMLAVSDDKKKLEEAVTKLCKLFGLNVQQQSQRAWLWLHLLELREYMAPRREKR